jgi:PAS domain S-box-containing protein
VRLRLMAPVLLVIAVIAGAFAVTRIESLRDGVLVLAGGLALAAVTGVLAVATERRRRATREVERYFTLSPEMVILAGFDGYWKRVNPAVEAVLGYTEREALARPFMEFVHPDDRERTEEEARRVVDGAMAYAFENRIVCKDGSYKLIEWTVTPVAEEHVMYGVGRDITERRRSESEQTALRRLATLVAHDVPQSEVFSAVAEEIGRLLGTEEIRVLRFGSDRSAVVVGSAGRRGAFPLGWRQQLEGDTVASRVFRTGRTARIDNYTEAGGPLAQSARSIGVRAVVGAPILVEGRLWGAITTGSTSEPLPPDTESRLLQFTELMATAIANAEARDALQPLADEQAALRRVATLVAQGIPPAELFSAVTKEVAQVFSGVEPPLVATVIRFDPGPECVLVGASRPYEREPIGSRWEPKDLYVSTRVLRTGRSARVDEVDLESVGGPDAEVLRLRRFLYQVGSPVVAEGRLWGAMTLNSREALPPDTNQRLESFTELVATAIANAESRAEVERLAEEQAALRRVATLVARDTPSTEVFEAVATEVAKLLDTDITVLGRYDDDGAATAIGSWSASPVGVPVGTRSIVGGHNVLTLVAETGKPARVDGYDDASGEAADIARRFGWTSSIAAPVIVEDRLWGVMLVATQRPEPFPAGAEHRLAAFTDLVATAVANAEAQDEVRRFGDEQAALGRVATLVAAGAAPEEVFTAVVEEVSSLLGLERIELVRYDGDATGTVIAASGEHPFPAGSSWSLDDPSVMATVARTRHSARIDDYSNLDGEIARTARSAGFRSAIGAPITVEGRLWGVIIAISTDPEPIPERSAVRLGQFTELVGTAVANADARHALELVAAEQATLRRIATLVAEGLQPEEIFAVVIEEVGRLFGTDLTTVGRFESEPPAFVAVALGKGMQGVEIGTRWALDDPVTASRVFQSGRSVRVNERLRERSAALADMLARLGVVSTVSAPIMVEGRLWGAVTVSSIEQLPADTEERLDKFAELVATAIANAEGKAELAASRRRIVAASDEARRQIERDLHDGTQQRLVSLGLALRAAEADLPPERDDLRAQLSGVAAGLVAAVEDLQEISRGIHPAILSKGGLGPALRALAHRSAIPVDLDIARDMRLEEPIEVAAYFVASEALANAVKHSDASRIDVLLEQRDGRLLLSVRDDGVGGADAARGSGLVGLTDRVEALGGSIRVSSRPGKGTQIAVELPVELELPQPAG